MANTPVGYPNRGIWFDFAQPDESGLPCAGEIQGFYPAALAALRGPDGDGTVIWCSSQADQVANFGLGFSDLNNSNAAIPIQVTLYGKADFISDRYGDQAPIAVKQLDNVRLIIAPLYPVSGEVLTYTVYTVFDYLVSTAAFTTTEAVEVSPGAVVGTAVVGTAVVGSGAPASTYQVVKAYTQAVGQGRIVQIGFTESSIYAWTCLGYILTLDVHNVGQLDEQ